MRFAGFWRRFLAHCIDFGLLNLAAWGLELAFVGMVYGARRALENGGASGTLKFDDTFDPFVTQIISGVIYVTLISAYYIHGHRRYGATLGKRLLRIRVVSWESVRRGVPAGAPLTRAQAVLRFFGYLLSYLPVGCGYLMAAFHPQKRALHDLIAGTVSVISVDEEPKEIGLKTP